MIEPAAAIAVAGALDQLRQPREHRGRISLGRRRLADGERDLALRLGEPGQRVEQQQYLHAAVAEILRDGGRQPRAVQAHERRIVGRRGDHHGAPHAVGPQGVAHEILHLAAALADQSDHRHVCLGVARHHAEQHRLADAGPREQADALAAAHRQAAN